MFLFFDASKFMFLFFYWTPIPMLFSCVLCKYIYIYMSVSDKNKDYSVFSRDKVKEVMREIYDL